MMYIIGDIILALTVLTLAAQNYQNAKHIENIEKWILNSERKKEL